MELPRFSSLPGLRGPQTLNVYVQDSVLESVIVFNKCAQLTRRFSFSLSGPGEHVVAIHGISTRIASKDSIEVRGKGPYSVLNISHDVTLQKAPLSPEDQRDYDHCMRVVQQAQRPTSDQELERARKRKEEETPLLSEWLLQLEATEDKLQALTQASDNMRTYANAALAQHIRTPDGSSALMDYTQPNQALGLIDQCQEKQLQLLQSKQELRQQAKDLREKIVALEQEWAKMDEHISQQQQAWQTEVLSARGKLAAYDQREETPFHDLYVTIQASGMGPATLNLTYVVDDAWWTPTYDLRADLNHGTMQVVYQASVWQTTDEEWKDAKLTLSTAMPTVLGKPPSLPSTYLREMPELKPTPRPARVTLMQKALAMGARARRTQPSTSTAASTQTASVSTTTRGTGTGTGTGTKTGTGTGTSTPVGPETHEAEPQGTHEHEHTRQQPQEGVAGSLEQQNLEQEQMGEDSALVREPEGMVELEDRGGLQEESSTDDVGESEGDETDPNVMRPKRVSMAPIGKRRRHPLGIAMAQLGPSSTGSAVVFQVGSKVTIPCTGDKRKVTLMIESLAASLRYYCVPELSETAYVQAHCINTTRFPLLPCKRAHVFVDSNLIGTTKMNLVQPEETFSTFLGPEPRIKVTYKQDRDLSRSSRTRLTGKVSTERYITTCVLQNLTPHSATVAVVQRVPKTKHHSIKVKVVQPSSDDLAAGERILSKQALHQHEDTQCGGGFLGAPHLRQSQIASPRASPSQIAGMQQTPEQQQEQQPQPPQPQQQSPPQPPQSQQQQPQQPQMIPTEVAVMTAQTVTQDPHEQQPQQQQITVTQATETRQAAQPQQVEQTQPPQVVAPPPPPPPPEQPVAQQPQQAQQAQQPVITLVRPTEHRETTRDVVEVVPLSNSSSDRDMVTDEHPEAAARQQGRAQAEEEPATAIDSVMLNKHTNNMIWTRVLASQETKTILFEYDLEYPHKMQVDVVDH